MSRTPLLWLVLALYSSLALLYALLTPPFEKPDESWHFAFSMYVAERGRLPVQRLEGRDHLAEQEGSQPPLFYALHALLIRAAGLSQLEEGYARLTEVNPHYGGRPGAWRENVNQYVHQPCGEPCREVQWALLLGRGLSIVAGAVALVAAWHFLAFSFPQYPTLPPVVVALMALLPQFLHIASSVSNDMVTVAGVNGTLALGAMVLARPRWQRATATGTAAGLAALSKVSGLAAGASVGAALLLAALRAGQEARPRWRDLLLFGASALAVVGWWVVRNLRLYGEPTATAIHLTIYGTPPAPLTVARAIAEWRAIADSYWASFGWGALNLDQSVYGVARWLALALALLTAAWLLRAWRTWSPASRWATALMLLLAALVAALLAHWMRLTVAPLGRLLFPAALPIAFVLGGGLVGLPPRRVARWLPAALIGALLLLDLGLARALIRPAYQPPAPLAALPADAQPLGLHFGPSIVLEGATLPPTPVRPGATIPITLYWRATEAVPTNYSVSVKLLGRDEALLGRYDSHPAGGRFPTRAWPAAALIPDRHWLVIAPDAEAPVLARLQVNLFDATSQETVATRDGAGNEIVPQIARLLVRPDHPAASGGEGYRIAVQRVAVEQGQLTIAFEWQPEGALPGDYHAFLHLVTAEGQPPLGQPGDFEPLHGWLPTSLWQGGDRLDDRAAMPLPDDLPAGTYLLLMGLYDPVTLQPVPGGAGQGATPVATLMWEGGAWRLAGEAP